MPRFDWERRPTPAGLRHIENNRKVEQERADRSAHVTTDQRLLGRATWEDDSMRKVELMEGVRRSLAPGSAAPEPEAPPPRVPTSELLRRDELDKVAEAERRRAGAAQRREALLEHARQLEAGKESERASQAAAILQRGFERSCDELRALASRRQARDTARTWQKQVEQRQQLKHLAAEDELRLVAAFEQHMARAEERQQRDEQCRLEARIKTHLELEAQQDENDARMARAAAAAALEASAQRARWAAEEEEHRQQERAARQRQHRLAAAGQAENAWCNAQAAERAEQERIAAEAAAGKAARAAQEALTREGLARAERKAAAAAYGQQLDEEADQAADDDEAAEARWQRELAAQQAKRCALPASTACTDGLRGFFLADVRSIICRDAGEQLRGELRQAQASEAAAANAVLLRMQHERRVKEVQALREERAATEAAAAADAAQQSSSEAKRRAAARLLHADVLTQQAAQAARVSAESAAQRAGAAQARRAEQEHRARVAAALARFAEGR
jgi:hypothetical protein